MTQHSAAPSMRPNKKSLTLTLIAGTAGVALLAGGTTFALWHKEQAFVGGTVQNASFDLAGNTANGWVDPTSGTDASSLAGALVPDSEVENAQPLTVTLSDGVSADLAITVADDSTLQSDLAGAHLTATAYIVDKSKLPDGQAYFNPSVDTGAVVAEYDLTKAATAQTNASAAVPTVGGNPQTDYLGVVVVQHPDSADDTGPASGNPPVSTLSDVQFDLEQTPADS